MSQTARLSSRCIRSGVRSPVFITGPEFLPELREQRHRTLTLIGAAADKGQTRVAEMNQQILTNPDKMIGAIEKDEGSGAVLNTRLTRPVNNTVLVVSPQVRAMIEGQAQDNGRKRHIAVDTIGLLLTVLVTAAGIQDRDAARPLLRNLKKAFPAIKLTWADGGYAGKLVTWAKKALKLTVQIVSRPAGLHTFQALPRRWVVERTLA